MKIYLANFPQEEQQRALNINKYKNRLISYHFIKSHLKNKKNINLFFKSIQKENNNE